MLAPATLLVQTGGGGEPKQKSKQIKQINLSVEGDGEGSRRETSEN